MVNGGGKVGLGGRPPFQPLAGEERLVYLVAKDSPARSSFAIGGNGVSAHWLIDADHGGASDGKVGLIEIGRRGSAHLPADARREEMVFVLHGSATVREGSLVAELGEGSVIFLPANKTVELRPGDDALRLLLI